MGIGGNGGWRIYQFKEEDERETALSEIVKAFMHHHPTLGYCQKQNCYHNIAPASLLPRSLVLARRYVWQLKSLVSKCLAVVTLVDTEDDWETQASSMEIVCHFIESYSSRSKNSENDSVPVLAAALPSWSLLLTTVDVQRLNNKHWKGVMSYIIELLEVEEKSIFEKGMVETFSSEACTYLFPQEWKDKIIDQVRQECNSKWEILKLFEDEYELQMRMDICCHSLMLSTLLQLKQVEVQYFSPDIRKKNCSKRFQQSPNSSFSKARAQLR